MVMRLTRLDVPELAKPLPPVVSQVAFGIFCSAAAILLRMLTDIWLPGAGPFALTIPLVLIATLFGHWVAGVICQTIVAIHAWYYVLPIQGSFDFEDPADGPRVIVNVVAGYFVVALAELFRRAVRQALSEREALLLELQHRVKNSFMSVASVLRLQMRNAKDSATQAALQSAIGRVESYARAYSFLYHRHERGNVVNMRAYLKELCAALEAASSSGDIVFKCDAADTHIHRDRAIVIGLLVNEVSTNSFKHAFAGKPGEIRVNFTEAPKEYLLNIADNGRGIGEGKREGGLGLQLIDVLVQQADGRVEIDSGESGTAFRFSFAR
jgi:two-component sensor histidine kinase